VRDGDLLQGFSLKVRAYHRRERIVSLDACMASQLVSYREAKNKGERLSLRVALMHGPLLTPRRRQPANTPGLPPLHLRDRRFRQRLRRSEPATQNQTQRQNRPSKQP
jgi:hypothetical protein